MYNLNLEHFFNTEKYPSKGDIRSTPNRITILYRGRGKKWSFSNIII
jgi:hypothetical protein